MLRRISISEEVWEEIAKRGSFGEDEDMVLRRVFGLPEKRKKPVSSGQDRASGAKAAAWGRETADKIAELLGAKKTNPRGNEYELDGEPVTIRCARVKTNSVGVTYKMMDRVNAVIAALETPDGAFELFKLKASELSDEMRDTRSKGPSAGRVGIIRTSIFRNRGELIRTLKLDEAEPQ